MTAAVGDRPGRVDLKSLIHEVRFAMTALFSERPPVQIYVDVDPAVGEVPTDGVRLRQVVHSLLKNALKSTPDAGLLTVHVAAEGVDCFRLEVADNRVVVGQDKLEEIERRYPVHDFPLALAKHLVELEGGRVGMLSSPIRGTVAYAVLPARAEAEVPGPVAVRALETGEHEGGPREDAPSRPVAVMVSHTRKKTA